MKKRKPFFPKDTSNPKRELNQSRSNNSSILNTQNSLSKIVKTEEDSLFKSNRYYPQMTDKEMEDIEKKLTFTTNGVSVAPVKEEAVVYIRENIISNREVKLPKKLIQPQSNLKTETSTSIAEEPIDVKPPSGEIKPKLKLSSTDKKMLFIGFGVIFALLVIGLLVILFFKVLKK